MLLAPAARGTLEKDRASQQSFVFEVTACALGTTGKAQPSRVVDKW
jgi:hypothetical protein